MSSIVRLLFEGGNTETEPVLLLAIRERHVVYRRSISASLCWGSNVKRPDIAYPRTQTLVMAT